jgi:hypothetical protein
MARGASARGMKPRSCTWSRCWARVSAGGRSAPAPRPRRTGAASADT